MNTLQEIARIIALIVPSFMVGLGIGAVFHKELLEKE